MRENKLAASSVLWVGVVAWLSFVPLLFLVPRQELFELLNAVVFSVAVGVVVGYAPGVWRALKSPINELRAGCALQIGIAVGWSATAFVFGILWLWRFTGKESIIVDHGVNAWSRWILCTAGFLHLAASGSIDGAVPLRSYLRAGILTAIGLIIGALILFFAGPLPVRL